MSPGHRCKPPPMELRFTNTLTRKKEVFEPLTPGMVGIYVCGPTVYSHAHLGHAKSYISFDVIVKFLRHLGYRVRYVQNITDVGHLLDDSGEDRILRRARLDQVHPYEIVDTYMRSYFEDMENLGVAHPSFYVRATQHIVEQIELVKVLLAKRHAYVVDGSVYFSVASWPGYGILSGRRTEEQVEGTRVGPRGEKRDPRDFALWKKAEGGHILRWPSPWGEGFPGWHIECSAMAMKYLGETFDIHGGGLDNQFPHHECEIAQSVAATGGGFARTWLHNNMVTVDGTKMSKSLGNTVTIKDLLAAERREVIRAFVLGTHYRSTMNYTSEAIAATRTGLSSLHEAAARARARAASAPETGDAAAAESLAGAAETAARDWSAAMHDDVNAPAAIAALHDLARSVNRAAQAATTTARAAWLAADRVFSIMGGDVLGVIPKEPAGASGSLEGGRFVDLLLEVRTRLREARQFALTDLIRDRLAALEIEVMDGKDGASWKPKNA